MPFSIQLEIVQMRRDRSRHRWGLRYSLRHPNHGIKRIKEYLKVIRQKRGLVN